MKANRIRFRAALRPALIAAAAATSLLVSACSEPRLPPSPVPTPAPRAVAPPPPPPRRAGDWRQMALTPGDWTYAAEAGGSVARFADGALALRCNRAGGTISLERAGAASGPVPVTVLTQNSLRNLTAQPQAEGQTLAAVLPARDPLLDAMAFSRGRFAMEVAGLAPVIAPSWPEVSRVIEDCR